jgi:sporulation protein YlmC with PRC-barrel domain
MTSLRNAIGKPVILRETAERLGEVRYFAVDGPERKVTTLVATAGRGSLVVDWVDIQNVGPDAVIVDASREPTDSDARAVSGALSPIDKRVLTDHGNELVAATDVEIDDSGTVLEIVAGDDRIDGTRLRGVGSYAVVVEADAGEA